MIRPIDQQLRAMLGRRLRSLRKGLGLSQARLGQRSSLTGKFIGEVERGEKSITIDSLYRVSLALQVPLRDLADVSATPELLRPRAGRNGHPGAGHTAGLVQAPALVAGAIAREA
jgi:transcriptional regulator with XRE-family HTH domain